jgi:MATE family, multidrug efflux pump
LYSIAGSTGTIGPIIGQNFGARQFDRVRSVLYGALAFAALITVLAWLTLSIAAPALVVLFKASGEAAQLIVFFCRWLAPLFVFFGTLFVCNAACNTLGRPHYATALNWGRATLGTIPFVALGAHWGATGALVGYMAGGIAFGIVAILVVYHLIVGLERDLH